MDDDIMDGWHPPKGLLAWPEFRRLRPVQADALRDRMLAWFDDPLESGDPDADPYEGSYGRAGDACGGYLVGDDADGVCLFVADGRAIRCPLVVIEATRGKGSPWITFSPEDDEPEDMELLGMALLLLRERGSDWGMGLEAMVGLGQGGDEEDDE